MRVNPIQLKTATPLYATDMFGLQWMDDRDRAAVRRVLPVADAFALAASPTPHAVAKIMRLASVEALYRRMSSNGYRALMCVLADLLSPEERA